MAVEHSATPTAPCLSCWGRRFWRGAKSDRWRCARCDRPVDQKHVAATYEVPRVSKQGWDWEDPPPFDTLPKQIVVADAPPRPAYPQPVPRDRLPGGRIMAGMVYVGRGDDKYRLGQHPWIDPCRVRKGDDEETNLLNAQREEYVTKRLGREPDWLRPLARRTLVYYGRPDWARILARYANDGRYD